MSTTLPPPEKPAVEPPIQVIDVKEDGAGPIMGPAEAASADGGAGPESAIADHRGPALRTRHALPQALIGDCYPAAARRRGQEGRGAARVDVDVNGRAGAVGIERDTGFAELNPASGCVARREQFAPGRRDRRAAEATPPLPICSRPHGCGSRMPAFDMLQPPLPIRRRPALAVNTGNR